MSLEVVENQFVLPVDITKAGKVTKTLNTAGTYVDKNIKLDITTPKAEYEVKSANSVTATVAMVDNNFASETETRYPITITADATAPEVKVGIKPGKAGFAAETDVVTVAKADAEQASKKIYIKEGALASNSTASAEGHGVVLGEKATTAPAAGFYVKASAAGSASVETAGWVDPNNNKPVNASGDAFYPIAEATLLNEVAEGAQESYTEKDAPVLISGKGLYINEGYIKNTYIPLARLVPDEANVVAGENGNSNLIYKTVSVYDKDANLIAGTMGDATLSAIVADKAAATVDTVTFTRGEDGKFAVAGTGTISGTASVSVDKVGYAKKELTGTGNISGTATVAAKVEAATTKATADKANITVKPVIAKETSTALSDDITTTAPTSGHYVAVSAAAIENTATVTPSISKAGYALEGTTGTPTTVTGGSEASGSYYVKIQDADHTIAKQDSTITAPSTTVTTSFAEGENFVQPAVYTAEQATTGKFIKIDANATTADGSVVARAKCTSTEGYITAISKDITIRETVSVEPAAAVAQFIKVYDGEITE